MSRFDPSDVGSQAELRRQAGVSLASWLERYRGCAEHIGFGHVFIGGYCSCIA